MLRRHGGVPFAPGTMAGSSHATAHGNCAKSVFVCPFHGWRWNLDGENTLVCRKHLFSGRQRNADDINLSNHLLGGNFDGKIEELAF